jgi:small subunit ribosomal protein S9
MNTENMDSANPTPPMTTNESPPTGKAQQQTALNKVEPEKIIWATGGRKTSTAQVRMVPSRNGGRITVNSLSVNDYFKGNHRHALIAMQVLNTVKGFAGYDLRIKVSGGGLTGQAESIRHGIARALVQWNDKLRPQLRKEGFLTRDPRAVERKKSGQPKARKRFQYSKR